MSRITVPASPFQLILSSDLALREVDEDDQNVA